MMKIKVYLMLFFSLSFSWVSAQLVDSIFIPNHQYNEFLLHKIWENPTSFSALKLQDFTQTSLTYTRQENHLKRVQTAEEVNTMMFSSNGIFQINPQLKLLGDFNYQFSTEKNIGYVLSNQRTDNFYVLNPNYLFTKKASNWEKQNYALKGGAIYQIKNFDFGIITTYGNQSAFRKSDPRPEINTAEYSGKILAGYTYKNHQISAFGGARTQKDNHQVMAVNEYINAPANDEYFVRFSNGYGRHIYFNSFSKFLYKTDSKTFGGGYRFQNNNSAFFANYHYQKSMENLFAKDANGQVFFDENLVAYKYRLITHHADFSYLHQKNEHLFYSEIALNSITGDNYNAIEQGQNYRMTLDEASFRSIYQKTEGKKVKLGLTTQITLQDFSATDLLGVTEKKVKNLSLNIKASKDLYYSPDTKLNLETGINAYFPINSSLSYTKVSSTNVIYEGVIKNDQAYDDTSKIGPEIGVYFYKKINKKNHIKIFTQLNSVIALSNHYQDTIINYNKKSNFVLSSGISLFY